MTNKVKTLHKILLLFLDIDGVLNNFKWSENHPSGLLYRTLDDIDPGNIKLLSELLAQYPEIKIVIMSDWRKLITLSELKVIFNHFKVNPDQIIGYTPAVAKSQNREDEVLMFLKDYPSENYALVDNDDFFTKLKSKLVLTDPQIGLTNNSILEIKNILDLNEVK